MTFYLQTYPFGLAQERPARRIVPRWVDRHEPASEHKLGVNVREEEEAYVLSALVPGLTSEDLNIQVLEDVVRVEGEYKADDNKYLLREFPNGSFTRTLRLPVAIDTDHVEAKITDGVLTLRLPKAESARPKKIQVTSK